MRTRAVVELVAAVTVATVGVVAVIETQPAQPSRAYQAPRTPRGEPDLQGIWQVLNTAEYDIQDHGAHLGVPAGQGVVEGNEIPYQPWALAQKQKNFENRATLDPALKCFYPGVPRIMYTPYPFQIFQTEGYVAIFFEFGHHVRFIYTDGFPHHEEIPFWMGDSRGKWEGNTFVVDSRNFTDNTWFDRAGNFHSSQLRVIERFTRTGPDHIRYDVTIEDPKVFTRPWKMSMPFYRRQEPNARLLEYECFSLSVFEGGRYDQMIRELAPKGR
jgi:hypothetical protein